MRRLSRRRALGASALAALWGACGSGSKLAKSAHQMGERVQVGPLIYSIIEADWHNDLPSKNTSRIPQGKYCVIRLSITNAGNKDATIPLLNLEDEKGTGYLELTEGEGIEEWLGILRSLNPAETLQGRILFDVRPGNYSLRVTDGGEPDLEKTERVTVPFIIKDTEIPTSIR